MDYNIVNNTAENRFELEVEGKTSVVEYALKEDMIVFLHTEVPEELAGKGLGSVLARHVLDYARAHHLNVMPLCPFIKLYIDRHKEYQSISIPHILKNQPGG